MGPLILAGLLAIVALSFVLRPLYRNRPAVRRKTGPSPIEALEREKEGVYLAIRELDFDNKTGVVSDDDHKRLMARYRDHAVAIMREIDRLREESPAGGPASSPGEGKAAAECANCGLPYDKEHRFCTVCGHTLPAALALLIALALPAFLGPAPARAGEIAGKVVNQTTREAVAGQKILLAPDDTEDPSAETLTDEQGGFRFEDVAPGSYVVGSTYHDVPYAKRGIKVSEDAPRAEVELPVYETTTSDEDVSIRGDHLILQAAPEGVQTAEIVILENAGDRTYMGRILPSSPIGYGFFFALPEGYTELTAPEWLDRRIFNPRENGVHLALPLAPGTTQLTIAYLLPRSLWGTPLDRRMPFPVQAFNVAVPLNQGLEVKSKALPEQRTVNLNGREFLVMAGGPFAKETPLEARISGNLGLSAGRIGWLASGLLTTALGLAWVIRRGRGNRGQA